MKISVINFRVVGKVKEKRKNKVIPVTMSYITASKHAMKTWEIRSFVLMIIRAYRYLPNHKKLEARIKTMTKQIGQRTSVLCFYHFGRVFFPPIAIGIEKKCVLHYYFYIKCGSERLLVVKDTSLLICLPTHCHVHKSSLKCNFKTKQNIITCCPQM